MPAVRLLCLPALLALLVVTVLAVPAGPAGADGPLLMEGKQTLYQRVLSRPGAELRAAPERTAEPVLAPTPFEIFHVFERRQIEGAEWLALARPFSGPIEGWAPATDLVDWRQTIVAAFANPAGRGPSLFFRDRDSLLDLLESEFLLPEAEELRRQAGARSLPEHSPVIAIEPDEHIDIAEQFYILPILEADEAWLDSGYISTVLRVASVPLSEAPASAPGEVREAERTLEEFRVGIAFVIDTTLSMDPYIERTVSAVERLVARLEDSDAGARASVALIGFRDSTEVADLEYLTRLYSDFVPLSEGDRFLERARRMRATTVSSRGFTEDGFAGVLDAIEMDGWEAFGGRYIIYISDADARKSSDPLSSTGLNAMELRQLARDRGMAIYSMHLLTPPGAHTHEQGAQQYTELSRFEGIRPLYYPVAGGDVENFGRQIDALADSLVSQIEDTLAGLITQAEAAEGAAADVDDIAAHSRLVGRAMQLAYLGRQAGTQAPPMFEAWLPDHDLTNPSRQALDIRLLLSKNQLSDLARVIEEVLEAGFAHRLESDEFFGRLRSVAAWGARDPDSMARAETESLGDLLGEFLDDLPYRSQFMEIDVDTWRAMGPGAQRELLDTLDSKLNLYRRYNATPALWTALYDGAPEGEWVFPLPLDALP